MPGEALTASLRSDDFGRIAWLGLAWRWQRNLIFAATRSAPHAQMNGGSPDRLEPAICASRNLAAGIIDAGLALRLQIEPTRARDIRLRYGPVLVGQALAIGEIGEPQPIV